MTRTVVITGALSGIGTECVRCFAREGYRVIFSGRNPENGAKLLNEFHSIHTDIYFIKADIAIEEQVSELVNEATKISGNIDAVLNVAGTEGKPSLIENTTVEDFHAVFNTNVLGTQLVMKYFLPVMLKQGAGSFINFSSVAGLVGMPGGSIYAASKHAVNGLTRSAALEVAGSGVRVNAIAPGPVATEMFDRFVGHDEMAKKEFLSKLPSGRIVTTEEIAGTALFLASDAAKSIVGQIITVDGGYAAG
ncbi:SDR family oxidoreductase [Enterobacteriaceae bacterium H11S18]|uniref:SDR family NAD(P)-dependent oxidoreductase n=1 Tax=Dryocola clanedunensis TaxID=2925396 RepID=UPI0022F0462F|nr:SDR family oxidoreductase [Dryocola clanedunensis]MCT4709429.1 SDR family oxidoreductase [Dryocola clanedunensis]